MWVERVYTSKFTPGKVKHPQVWKDLILALHAVNGSKTWKSSKRSWNCKIIALADDNGGLKEYIQMSLRREKQSIHQFGKIQFWHFKIFISQVSFISAVKGSETWKSEHFHNEVKNRKIMAFADDLRLWRVEREYIPVILRREKQSIRRLGKIRLWRFKLLISQVSLYKL